MLEDQLEKLTKQAFSSMPNDLAEGLKKGIREVKSSQLRKNARNVGDLIGDLTLPNIYSEDIDLKSLLKNDYLLINFFRGSWCPFCSMELREYERLKDEFHQNGIDIVAISPEVTKYSLKTKEENSLSFEVLSDENSKAMKEFGIVFTLSPEVKKIYDGFGIDLKEQNGNDSFEMPVPATYILNKDFQVVFAHIEEDYMTRVDPLKVLEFIKTIEDIKIKNL